VSCDNTQYDLGTTNPVNKPPHSEEQLFCMPLVNAQTLIYDTQTL